MPKLCESNEGDVFLKVFSIITVGLMFWSLTVANKHDDLNDLAEAKARVELARVQYAGKMTLYDKLLATGIDPMEAGCVVNEPTPMLKNILRGSSAGFHPTTACGVLMSQKQITNTQIGTLKNEFDDQLAQAREVVESLMGELTRVQTVMQDMSHADSAFLSAIEGWTQQRKQLADTIRPKDLSASKIGG